MGDKWTEKEIEILRQMYPDHFAQEVAEVLHRAKAAIYCKAKELGIKSTKEKIRRAGGLSQYNPNVISSQYKKGNIPINKGKKISPEVYAKIKNTMFKKGGHTPNKKPVGTERVNRDGYIEIKVADPNIWKLKHRILWEEANGKIPESHNVQFKNHNPSDCRLENLYLISKADQMAKENSFHAKYPKELQEIIHLKGVVNRAIHKAEKNGK